jgi:hypothetical protein
MVSTTVTVTSGTSAAINSFSVSKKVGTIYPAREATQDLEIVLGCGLDRQILRSAKDKVNHAIVECAPFMNREKKIAIVVIALAVFTILMRKPPHRDGDDKPVPAAPAADQHYVVKPPEPEPEPQPVHVRPPLVVHARFNEIEVTNTTDQIVWIQASAPCNCMTFTFDETIQPQSSTILKYSFKSYRLPGQVEEIRIESKYDPTVFATVSVGG